MDEFMNIAGNENNKACYGFRAVQFALKQKAVKDLLVSDKLYWSFDPEEWNKYVWIIAEAKKQGASIHHLSSAHAPGERLDDMTGIGAILSYELPGVMDIEGSDSEEEQKSPSKPLGGLEAEEHKS